MKKLDLNGKWELKGTSLAGETLEISADVPGSALSAVLKTPQLSTI